MCRWPEDAAPPVARFCPRTARAEKAVTVPLHRVLARGGAYAADVGDAARRRLLRRPIGALLRSSSAGAVRASDSDPPARRFCRAQIPRPWLSSWSMAVSPGPGHRPGSGRRQL